MSYSPVYVPQNVIRLCSRAFKEHFFPEQWKESARWGEIYDTITTKIPHNCSMLDLGAGNEFIKKYAKHNEDYFSIDLNKKCMLQHDLDFDLLDLWQYRAKGGQPLPASAERKQWEVGLCVEVLEYIKDPVRMINHYKQFAKKWIFTSRVGRPDHIYEDHHPLQNRWRSHAEFVNFIKPLFKNVDGSVIQTSLTTCSGKMKPFAMVVASD